MRDVDAWIGASLADHRFRIVAKLGEGGMGMVYRARDQRLETDVVIKVPRADGHASEGAVLKRFSREIRALVRLHHPHVVPVLDLGEHEGIPFVVMQYLSGGSLLDRYRGSHGRSRMAPTDMAPWLPRVAEALDFIHAEGYLHRDVKPANILFDEHGNVVLSDFGLAKALSAAASEHPTSGLTEPGMHIGTPGYVAPEVFKGRTADGRQDQYALAMAMYELLTGGSPFHGIPLAAILWAQSVDDIPNLATVAPATPAAIVRAIHRGLASDPEKRFRTCADFASAVLAAMPPEPVATVLIGEEDAPAPGTSAAVAAPRSTLDAPLPGASMFAPTTSTVLGHPPSPAPVVDGPTPRVSRRRGRPVPESRVARWIRRGVGAAVIALGLGYGWTLWSRSQTITREDVVRGHIAIDRGSDTDTYQVDLEVQHLGGVHYRGTVERAGKLAQTLRMHWNDLTITGQQPVRAMGTVTGPVPIDDKHYDLRGLTRTTVEGASPFSGGIVRTRASLLGAVLSETLTFEPPLVIPGDPALGVGVATISGSLTYDYRAVTYRTNLVLTCGAGPSRGVVGTILWEKKPGAYLPTDAAKGTTVPPGCGLSSYVFNLRFGDTEPPERLTGRIDMAAEGVVRRGVDGAPSIESRRAKIDFHLNSEGMRAETIHAFVMLWLLISGPVYDE